MLTIKWHGHACFELIDSANKSIVIDPHDGRSIGIKPPSTKADAVLITHEHFDHNSYNVVLKSGGLVYSMKEGRFSVLGHEVLGTRVYHDKARGRRRGEVVMYRMYIEGISVLHAGDLGHVPSAEEMRPLIPVDIAMIPTGGTFTIDASEALQLAERLGVKVVIPMHYWVEGINLPLAPLNDFLKLVSQRDIIRLESNSWTVSREALPSRAVVVFKLT